MRLSILDQAPISNNMPASEALKNSIRLAEIGDELGYSRFWLAEHHGMNGLASSAPEVTLGAIGMVTKNIRLGSGATLLPYYKPFKVAEIFNTLATLYGDRIDIGIGRAPGGGNEVSEALSDNYLSHVFKMPELVAELQRHLENKTEQPKASPIPQHSPKLWMLGTSEKSAIFARDNQLNYCFGKFMSDNEPESVLSEYRTADTAGETIMTINVFCHEDEARAKQLAKDYAMYQVLKSADSNFKGLPATADFSEVDLTPDQTAEMHKIISNLVAGTPEQVGHEIKALSSKYQVDEFMIVTITHDFEDKINSYRLVAARLLS